MSKDILVFVEIKDGGIHSVSLELLGKAKELSRGNVVAVIIGENAKQNAKTSIKYGASKAFYFDTKEYITLVYTKAVVYAIKKIRPEIVLFGATHVGRDLAPRVSVRVSVGLTADCTGLEMKEDGTLLMTRPTFGGSLMATIISPNARPQMATVRKGVMEKALFNENLFGDIEEIYLEIDERDKRVEIIETVKKEKIKSIDEEDTLIVGGRGIKNDAMYKKLFELAALLNGGVGVSRALVEEHIAPYERQIGQTGKTVRPSLYISFGVSGAIQHITGMEKSKKIIALNNDKNAPIFKFADLGIVSSLEKVIPLLIDKIKKGRK